MRHAAPKMSRPVSLLALFASTLAMAHCGTSPPSVEPGEDGGTGPAPTAPDAGTPGSADASTSKGTDAGADADAPRDAVPTLALGADHTCATLDDRTVKCWGYNARGALGIGDRDNRGDAPGEMGGALPTVALGVGRTALEVRSGGSFVCAVLDDRSVKCWGSNDRGQLGLGDTIDRGRETEDMGDALPRLDLGTGRTVQSLTAGAAHTCAILDDASIRCWGDNDSGQLGLGDTTARGTSKSQMGSALAPVPIGTGRSAKAIAAGARHTCAILDDGSVKCWGRNGWGQLGLGDKANRGSSPNQMGDALARVDLGPARTALAIAAGSSHTCAILDDRSVKCWGSTEVGQLGLGEIDNHRGDASGEMGAALPRVELGTGRAAVAIAAGSNHTCVILDDHSLKCWGDGGSGQLGYGDVTYRGAGPFEMGDALPAVALGSGRHAVSLSLGGAHTCVVLDDHSIKCWGRNAFGTLGLGDTDDRGDGPGEMGAALPTVMVR